MSTVEKILRSPLTTAFMIVLIGYEFLLLRYPEYLPAWIVKMQLYPVLSLFLAWIVLLLFHNLRHPDRKIRFFHYLPLEFREEDEGLQWMTYRACRKAYIFVYSAIPIALILTALLRDYPFVPIVALTVVGAVPCLIYWLELRKWIRSTE